MFVHMSIHYPKAGQENYLINSMHRFGAAIRGRPGNFDAHTLKDEKTGCLIGIAAWASIEHWQAARPAMIEAVKDDDFDVWETRPPDVFHLIEV